MADGFYDPSAPPKQHACETGSHAFSLRSCCCPEAANRVQTLSWCRIESRRVEDEDVTVDRDTAAH